MVYFDVGCNRMICVVAILMGAGFLIMPSASQAQRSAVAESPCGNPFVNHFGPWDYRSATPINLSVVENVHFTPGIESMTRPGTTLIGNMAADVAYTLHVFPNHHRALITMVRLGEKQQLPQPQGAKFTIDCYFQRAVQFRPDDTVARALYAQYLGKQGRKPEAMQQLARTTIEAKDSPISHYNIGLLYFELGEYDAALEQAHRALQLAYPKMDLAEKLRGIGKWREPDKQ